MSTPDNPPPRTPLHWTAGGCALVVFGLVILIPSGLCTAIMGLSTIGSMFSKFGGITSGIYGLIMTLVLGGPFVLLGAFLIRQGFKERKPD